MAMPIHSSEESATLKATRQLQVGVSVLVFLVLLHTLYWPSAWALSALFDRSILTSTNLFWTAPVAAVFAYLGWRLVYPVEYPRPKK